MISKENQLYLDFIINERLKNNKLVPIFNLSPDSKNWYPLKGLFLKIINIQDKPEFEQLNYVTVSDRLNNSFRLKLYLNKEDDLKIGDIIKTYGGMVNGKLRTPIGFKNCKDNFTDLSIIYLGEENELPRIKVKELIEMADKNITSNKRLSYLQLR